MIPKLIIAGLAASVSPVALMVLISVMLARNALRNSLVFLTGYTVTMVAIGVVGVFVLHAGGSGTKTGVDAYIDIALGALCLLAIPLAARKKKGGKEQRDYSSLKATRVFLLGIVTMLLNASTIICYLSGAHVISEAHLGVADKIAGLAVLTAVSLVTLIIPIVLYLVFPDKSQKALHSFGGWLSRHGKVIGVAVLAVFAVYLLVKGITAVA